MSGNVEHGQCVGVWVIGVVCAVVSVVVCVVVLWPARLVVCPRAPAPRTSPQRISPPGWPARRAQSGQIGR